jgi:predicted nucleic acid-binding protein
MPSNSYLLDTNTIIYALQRRVTLPTADYSISVITEMELLSFPQLSNQEEKVIRKLLSHFSIISLDESIKEKAIAIRRTKRLKLPDAIIVATAYINKATLVTSDKALHTIPEINVLELDNLLSL